MRFKILALLLVTLIPSTSIAAESNGSQGKGPPSMIIEVEGASCMGQEKSRQQTRQDALTQAKRMAAERALTYIKSETRVENGMLMSDLINAYSNAQIKVLAQTDVGWYKEEYPGSFADECFKVKIKAEVLPDPKVMSVASRDALLDDPTAPLSVRLWTSKEEYRLNQKIRIYLRGNKPFYALIVYKDSAGNVTQLLPNPYRAENYFRGGVIYEMPSGEDRFVLEVSPPYGEETITLYAATSPLGGLDLVAEGGVYKVKNSQKDVGTVLRGIKPVEKEQKETAAGDAVEFAESPVAIKTRN